MSTRKLFLAGALVLVCLFPISSVGASFVLWSRTYGGPGVDIANSLIVTSDGGFALAGGGLLVKTDEQGVMEWSKTYDIPADSLVEAPDGGYALAGTKDFHAECDFWLFKTDSLGNMEWNQTYGGTWYESNPSLIATSDGGYALAGRTYDYGGSDVFDFLLVKTDANGNMEWNRTYGDIEYVEDCFALIETSDGGYALAGSSWDFFVGHQPSDFWLVKTDRHGNMQWNHTYVGPNPETANSLVETSDGGYALAGSTYSFDTDNHDILLVKTDATGNMEWNQTYGGANGESANSLVVTPDGGFALAGSTNSFGAGEYDFWLIKTDAMGIPEFPSWIIPPLFISATLAAVTYRKKLHKTPNKQSY